MPIVDQEYQLPVNLISDKQFFIQLMREKDRLARSSPENAEILEEFLSFVRQSEERIKSSNDDKKEKSPLNPPKDKIAEKGQPKSTGVAPHPAPVSPDIYSNTKRPIDEQLVKEQFKIEQYSNSNDHQPVNVPVYPDHLENGSLEAKT